MSHFACPLCGKNVAVSTFNPENLELDVKGFSYRGLGYAKGFMKIGEHSILGDEEISPSLARRVLQLGNMFLKEKIVSNEDIEKTFGVTINNNQYYNSMNNKKKTDQATILALQNRAREMEEENLLNREVDYILRNGLEFADGNCLVIGEFGWGVKLSSGDVGLELYLNRVIIRLPRVLKNRLLQRINTEDDEWWYENMLKNAPRKKDMLDLMIQSSEANIIHKKDASGEIKELLIEPVEFDAYSTIPPLESVKRIVDEINSALKDSDAKRGYNILFQ